MSVIDLDMVEVPEGKFTMGANADADPEAEFNEEPQRQIYLSTYKISRTPVTISLWMKFLNSSNHSWNFHQEIAKDSPSDSCPITYVSWFDANKFVSWLTNTSGDLYSLPTEAQWEKACRGTSGQLYPWGNQEPEDFYTLPPVPKQLMPVGSCLERKSPYSCLDMWQNVAEWCFDWYNEEVLYGEEEYYNNPTDIVNPQGLQKGQFKVWRGGVNMWQIGWSRCSYRGFAKPNIAYPKLGFRVVLNF